MSDSFIAIVLAMGLSYFALGCHNIRVYRMIGLFLLAVFGVSLGLISDTLPMLMLAWAGILVGIMNLAIEIVDITKG